MLKKKILLLVLTIVLSTNAAMAFTAVSPSGHTIYYTIIWNTDSVYVSRQNYSTGTPSYSNLAGDVIIPSTVSNMGNTYTVAYIGPYAFSQCAEMESITLPNTIRSIESSAFNYCTGLTSIIIPNSVKTIGDYAFSNCQNLTSIVIPSSVKRIENGAFNACFAALSITVPSTTTNIGSSAFWLVRNLIYHGSATGSPWGANTVNGYIENGLVYLNSSKTRLVGCPINSTNVSIPNSVTEIGNNAFSFCKSIDSIRIPSSVTNIGDFAFYECSNLKHLFLESPIPPQVSTNYVFSDTSTIIRTLFVPCQSAELYSNTGIWNTFDSIFEIPMHVLNGNSGGNGSVVVEQQTCNSPAVITAIPDNGYRFVEWSDHDTSNPRTIILTSDSSIYAIFTDDVVSINAYSNDDSKGTVAPYNNIVHRNDPVNLTAIPKAGYVFEGWSNGQTENPYSFLASQDSTLYATFSSPDTIHDTTVTIDTLTITEYIQVHDTTYIDVPYAVHDTTYINVHDTTYIDVPYAVHDTTIVTDTVTLTEYVPVHDTTTVRDTTYLPVYIHDTTTVRDTAYLPVYLHDTTYINVHDTTYIDVPYAVHDTTYVDVHDTTYIDVPYAVHDTTYIDVPYAVHDTTYITLTDTVTNTVYDTIDNFIHDTTIVTDTLWLTQTDTLWLHDTVVVHDTVYITQEGIGDTEAVNAKVYSHGGQIVVEGAEGHAVSLYDINGRLLVTRQDEFVPLHFDVPASGTYMLRIGDLRTRKVVVIR